MTTIIGPSGNGKSTIADIFGFIADCLETDVEAACDAGNRGGQDDETGAIDGTKVPVALLDDRKLGVVTLGAMKQYSRIEKVLRKAVEEMEAWLKGGFNNFRKECPTYREVGKYKAEWAKKIGQHMKIHENCSPGFHVFIEELLQRLNIA